MPFLTLAVYGFLLSLLVALVLHRRSSFIFTAMTAPKYPTHGIALQVTERRQTTPLTLARVDIPGLRQGEVLIENVAAAQNPVDAKQLDNDFGIPTLPWTLGGDVSGRIIAVGEKVEHLKVGDRVASFLARKTASEGGYQQYTVAKAPQTFKVNFQPPAEIRTTLLTGDYAQQIPDHLSHEAASTLPLAFSTAVGAVFGDLSVPIPPPSVSLPLPLNSLPPILVWGGSSSVGAYAVQLARLSGYRVVATASPANAEYVKSLGAEVVVDYHDAKKAVQEIKEATGGNLGLVVDAVSENGSTAAAVKAIGPRGGVISLVLPVDKSVLDGRTDIQLVSSGARIVFEKPAFLDAFRFLTEALEAKKFKPNNVEVIPRGLLGVDEGFRRQRAHQISGVKLVYVTKDTPGLESV
ncbi:dehydrogenase [Pseudohyphozyma bogoriensis]|nr:dehydrogenase [Pseudohyphozyma bogoriensis]